MREGNRGAPDHEGLFVKIHFIRGLRRFSQIFIVKIHAARTPIENPKFFRVFSVFRGLNPCGKWGY